MRRELHPTIGDTFKDNYVLEFLGLPPIHCENRLQKALVQHMKQFILELGKEFIFIGEAFRLQVGNQDFFIDLLFFHRGLAALVAFELKIGKFMPEHLGQLNFYLEALDRDVKKPHENPSIGVLLCRDKDDEVVEYALSRNLSPALIAQYQLQLPDRLISMLLFSVFSVKPLCALCTAFLLFMRNRRWLNRVWPIDRQRHGIGIPIVLEVCKIWIVERRGCACLMVQIASQKVQKIEITVGRGCRRVIAL